MERGGGTTPHQISDEQYRNINWIEFESDEDHSSQRKYILKKCMKLQVSNNSTHEINIILMRPKDFIDVITSSRCVSEYRKYFITLAEIRRSYQESYVPWILSNQNNLIKQKDCKIDTLIEKVDEQKATINELLVNSRNILSQNVHLIDTVEDNKVEISKLHVKIDTLFEFLLSFARMTLPTWIGSSVIKQQFDTLAKNKDNNYALKHLKVLFLMGFYIQYDEPSMYKNY